MSDKALSSAEAKEIDRLMPGNLNAQLGQKLKYLLDINSYVGDIYYLDPTNGDDGNDGKSVETAFKTLPYAYSQLTANQNDVLFYISGTSSITLSSAFTWAKSYTHFIGICAPVAVGQRARIFQLSTATGVTSLITVSASSCMVKNLYIFHGVDDATSKVCVNLTGQRNYFENTHFAGIGHATMNVAGAASLKIDGGAENYFVGCSIGLDTIARDQNSTEILFDSAATRNYFKDCLIYGYISNAGHALVTIADTTGIDRWQIFDNCLFETDSTNRATSCTSIFSTPVGIVQGKIILKNCAMLTDGASGTGAWDSVGNNVIWVSMVAPAAAGAGGICTKI